MRRAAGIALCWVAVLVLTGAAAPSWDRIDFYCIVRDAQGRPVSALTKQQVQVLEAGVPRPIIQLNTDSANETALILRITSSEKLYDTAYEMLWRTFDRRPVRKILLIFAPNNVSPESLTTVRRWELTFFAEARNATVYVVGDPAKLARSELATLAEETGGRVVASELDMLLEHRREYHIVATPLPHGGDRKNPTGVFHTLEVRVAGATVQAPRSLYITPIWEDR